jgi:glycosyltransferase involved in cell wall biosynthesis
MRGHVAALLVQNQRYHDRRSLRRVFATLPVWYGRKLLGRLRNGRTEANAFVWHEITGALAGIACYLLGPRAREPSGRLPSSERDEGVTMARDPQAAGDQELVSVIVPAFNAAGTIGETLYSVCNQTYRNLEILVVDDGSTDATRDIVHKIARTDPRIRLIEKPHGGVSSARNLGLLESRGDFIAPVDAGDLWRPAKIARQMSAMQKMGDSCGLVYTWCAEIDHEGRVLSRKHQPLDEGHALIPMCRGNVVGSGNSALMRKRAMLDAGGYDPDPRSRNAQGCEDLKLHFAIAERHLFAVVKDHLTDCRRTERAISSDLLQMERSHAIVTAEFQERYPQYGELFGEARATFVKDLFLRAVRLRRPYEARMLAYRMLALDQASAIGTLLMLPVTLATAWAVPRARRLAAGLLGRKAEPATVVSPMVLAGGAKKMRSRHFAAGILTRIRDITAIT